MLARVWHIVSCVSVLAVTTGLVSLGLSSEASGATAEPFSGPSTSITAPDGVGGDNFGWATAVSGSVSLVGAYGHDAGAGVAYVYTGPNWTQQAELQAANEQPGDHFGEAVATDSTTVAIGAPGANGGAGAVYIFVASGNSWTQETELTASDGTAGDNFGQALVLTQGTLFVGAPGANASSGAGYVFTGSTSSWAQVAELTAPDGTPGDDFASSIALGGSTLIFGAPQAGAGAAYIFTGSGATWSEQAKLSEGSAGVAGDEFGYSVGVTGSTALVGAPGRTADTGTVSLFSSAGGSWTQLSTLSASDAQTGYKFGISLAVSSTSLLVGSSNWGARDGIVYAFSETNGTWRQTDLLRASHGGRGILFGESVALSGPTAVIGAWRATQYQGAAYVFTAPSKGSKWTETSTLLAPDGLAGGDFLGESTAFDGTTLAIGAPDRDSAQGAVYVYTADGPGWSLVAELTDPRAVAGDQFGTDVAVSGSTILVGASGTTSVPGAAYIYSQTQSGWSLQAKLAPATNKNDGFGHAVALSRSTAVVGGGDSVSVFDGTAGGWTLSQELNAPDGTSHDRYGFAVGVSSSALVVGAPSFGGQAGVGYFYGLNGTTWTLESELAGSDPAGGNIFGESVAVSQTRAVVGAPGQNNPNGINGHPGTAYVFAQANGAWTQEAEIEATGLHNGQVYGDRVAISDAGTTVVVTAPGGTVFLWSYTNGSWSETQTLSPPPEPFAAWDPIYGSSAALSEGTLVIGAPGVDSRAGAAFSYSSSS
jgi:hypothetical protein